jgi:hypothetical protein
MAVSMKTAILILSEFHATIFNRRCNTELENCFFNFDDDD